eukprot:gene24885-31276_t
MGYSPRCNSPQPQLDSPTKRNNILPSLSPKGSNTSSVSLQNPSRIGNFNDMIDDLSDGEDDKSEATQDFYPSPTSPMKRPSGNDNGFMPKVTVPHLGIAFQSSTESNSGATEEESDSGKTVGTELKGMQLMEDMSCKFSTTGTVHFSDDEGDDFSAFDDQAEDESEFYMKNDLQNRTSSSSSSSSNDMQ